MIVDSIVAISSSREFVKACTSPLQSESRLPARRTAARAIKRSPRAGAFKADLELDGKGFRAVRRKGHGSISTLAVGNAANHSGMGIPMLLCEIGREWHANVNSARLDKLKRRSQHLHKSLP